MDQAELGDSIADMGMTVQSSGNTVGSPSSVSH